MPIDEFTLRTYNTSANAFDAKFSNEGILSDYLVRIFELTGKENPVVFDVGCGSGKYATPVHEFTKNYTGLDISQALIDIARAKNPAACFVIGDMVTYAYPKGVDVVLCITSIVHMNKRDLGRFLLKIADSMDDNGILFLTCKGGKYREEVVVSKEGKRRFYFYQKKDIESVLPRELAIMESESEKKRGVEFLNMIIKKTKS